MEGELSQTNFPPSRAPNAIQSALVFMPDALTAGMRLGFTSAGCLYNQSPRMHDTVHIACCFDRRMELPFLVLANSIKRNLKKDRKVVVHAFHSDPPGHAPAFSRRLAAGHFEIRFQQVRNEYEGMPLKLASAATLMRFMLPTLLGDLDRVLYLDTDMVVLRDVAVLFDTDLEGRALGAVVDYSFILNNPKNNWLVKVGSNAWTVDRYLTEVVQLTDRKTYFNAGVLLMDLDRFRKEGLVDASIGFLERMKGKYRFSDQDALNHAVDGAFVSLDPRWNVNANIHPEKEFSGVEARYSHIAQLWKIDPWILHYCIPGKPWNAATRRTPWDWCFWSEAAECEALPLLAGAYLTQCGEIGLTSLHPPEIVLAAGKPALDKSRLAAHAIKFGHDPGVSSASLLFAAALERDSKMWKPGAHSVPAGLFRSSGGIPAGGALAFNLADAKGHLVYGPYFWYPPGNYEAVFEISLSPGAAGPQSRLVIEVTDDADRFLGQRFLPVNEEMSASHRTLRFAATGGELFLEFRVFADGFSSGMLHFSGVTLSAAEPAGASAG